MSQNKKIIVITGATGIQGSAVAHTFLPLPSWHVRAITRNPSSPTARALAAAGAEVVQADLSDLNSLRRAFKDATALFLNTDFWGPYRATRDSAAAYNTEIQHGRNAAIAAGEVSSLQRLIFSTLPGMKELSGGKYAHAHHCDTKAEIAKILQGEAGLRGKVSFLVMGAYATNALFLPRVVAAGEGKRVLRFTIPGTKRLRVPIIAAESSTGEFVRAMVESESETGQWVLGCDSYLSMAEVVDVWKRVTGLEVEVEEVDVREMHERFKIPWEVLDAPQFMAEFGYTGSLEVMMPEQLGIRMKSFEEWLAGRNWEEMVVKAEEELAGI
ncbi:isoform 3 of NmrA-like family domain-containing protein 1 [Aspergillus udagawae]|uniref:Isoform 3 of NmrA-like family domain-containing protein 1 n=1 Tax=Aspergillus udagawae TaxID=91492 RepID=A0A8H3N8C1_9EURO|nr:isoform 3 of NmrA-like family domain-containing protein 1 [Aspergillus udagawae]